MTIQYWYGVITGIGFSLTVWAVVRIITIRMWQKRRTITLAQMGIPTASFVNQAGEPMTKEMFEELKKENREYPPGQNIGVIKQEKKDKI